MLTAHSAFVNRTGSALSVRGAATTAFRPRVARAALGERRIEEGRRIPERDPPLAIRGATIAFPLGAAVEDHDLVAGALDRDALFHEDAAGPIERDEIGR